jgi:hypothetical protein
VSDEALRARVRELERQREADKIARDNLTTWSLAALVGILIWKAYQ